jgi:S1-C subfamily serine protease
MRRALVVGLLFCVQLCPIGAGAHEWSALVKELAKSVVPIEGNGQGIICTGFVINAKVRKDDHDKDYVATASHCEAKDMYADQTAAKVIARNTDKDLLVLEVDDLDRPALKLAKDNPTVGQEVVSFGYGYGLEKPMLRKAMISAESYIPYEGIGGPLFFCDATFVPGQSGGPVVNTEGEVVMMVQRGTTSVGIGVGAEILKSRMGRHWEKPAAKP